MARIWWTFAFSLLVPFGGLIIEGCSAADTTPSTDEPATQQDTALVFAVNPVSTPTPIKTILRGVAEDGDGALTSAADAHGTRKLKVWSCVDAGETHNVSGLGNRRTCTLAQRARRDSQRAFELDDFVEDAAGNGNPTDSFAEVNAYYHAEKLYSFITSEAVGMFAELPGIHTGGDDKLPLHVVVNYELPTAAASDALAPATLALFIPREEGHMGMYDVQGLFGIDGDVLVFGQGANVDFAYDGETIDHELGHAINHAVAKLKTVSIDSYGLNNMGWALDDGLADTFAFLMSKQPTLYAYLDLHEPGFARNVDGASAFPTDFNGLSVHDGLVVAGANWETFEAFTAAGLTDAAFARVLLLALTTMGATEGENTLRQYADAFLTALADDGHETMVPAVQEIFDRRGLFVASRAKDFSRFSGGPTDVLFLASAGNLPWATNFQIHDGAGLTRIAPAYVQGFVAIPETATTIVVTALAVVSPMNMTPQGTVALELFVRKETPILYAGPDANSAYAVALDSKETPTTESVSTPMGPAAKATWTLENLTPGSVYFLHFVNTGTADALVGQIKVVTE